MTWFFKVVLVSAVLCFGARTSAQTSFTDVTDSIGLGAYRAYAGDLHGPGSVFTDLNNDGYADLYLVNSDGATGFNHLYLNVDDGSGGRTFSLQSNGSDNALGAVNDTGTAANDPFNPSLSGEDRFRGVTGVVAGDYDNDGDVDLYVTNMGADNRLYQNQLIETGALSFNDVTAFAGVPGTNSLIRASDSSAANNNSDDSLTAIWFDPDRDGDLDLYVGNHNDFSDPVPFEGAPDTFYMNNGDGTFADVTAAFNLGGHEDANGNPGNYADTNGVVSSDIDNDGWPDLIVTNKSGRTTNATDNIDQIYINDGVDANGVWLGYSTQSYSAALQNSFGDNLITRSAMGISLSDIDNDGDFDIYISDNPESVFSRVNGSSDLFVNQLVETGTLSFEHGLVDTGLSWGVQIQDFDNDGDVEIHTTNDVSANNGYAALLEFNDLQNLVRTRTASDAANTLFQGRLVDTIPNGDSIANVVDISVSSGSGNFDANGRGNLVADYNRDGLVDLFIVNLNNDVREGALTGNPSALLLNTTSNSNNFLNVRLVGDPDNLSANGFATSRDAVGSRVIVSVDLDGDGDVDQLTREVRSGFGNAASTSSYDLMFGLGVANEADVSVIWADGRVTELGVVSANQFLVVDQKNASDPVPPTSQEVVLFFDDFDGAVDAVLDGTTPDMTQSNVAWNADAASFAADGFIDRSGLDGAYLDFDFQAGTVYVLEATFINDNPDWLAVGFARQAPGAVSNRRHDNQAQADGVAWLFSRNLPGMFDQGFFGGGGAGNPVNAANGDVVDPTQEIDVTIILDTAKPVFTVSYLLNGAEVPGGQNVELTDIAIDDIGAFGFSIQNGTGVSQISSICLSEIVDVVDAVVGDVNLDGVVDLLDVAPFVAILLDGGFQAEADINADGIVDLLDVAGFVDLILG